MGQKVNPIGLRLGIVEDWRSRWFATKDFPKFLEEDIKIRKLINKKLKSAGISRIEIERTSDRVKVDIHTARPGIVIGRKGSEVEILRSSIAEIVGKQVQVNIQEIIRPELDATIVAQRIAEQLEARISFRRAMKKAVSAAIRDRAKGIKVSCSGRLGGAEMCRTEWYREGRVPLHTLRAVIDYGFAEAQTIVGKIGIKVWIYKGDIVPGLMAEALEEEVKKPSRAKKQEVKEKEKEKVEIAEEKVSVPEEIQLVETKHTPEAKKALVITEKVKKSKEKETKPKKAAKKVKVKETPKETKAEIKKEPKTAKKSSTKKKKASKED